MNHRTKAYIAGGGLVGALIFVAGAIFQTDRDFRRAAKRTTWRDV